VNDTYGHNEGDYGLQMIADSLKCNADKNEICVRNGGDEFLLIGVGDYSDSDGEAKVMGILHTLEEKSNMSRKPYKVTASIGCSCADFDEDTNVDMLIGVADRRMYQNKKRNNRNRK
ncbi:MAG: GGDEF domain-containing protein, partial [Hominimerdicola sp.]